MATGSNGSDGGGSLAISGIIPGSGLLEDRMANSGVMDSFVKTAAMAAGLALLMASPAWAASIENPPGAGPAQSPIAAPVAPPGAAPILPPAAAPVAPPGAAAAAKVRGDVDGDRIEDVLAARIAASQIGDRFDVIVIFEGPDAVGRGRAAAGPFAVTREFSIINGFQALLTGPQIRGLSRAPGLFQISETAEVRALDIPSNDDMGVTLARFDFIDVGVIDGNGVTICVPDTGIDASHELFDTKGPGMEPLGPLEFHDAVNGLLFPYDDHGHGSHTSGIAAGDGVGGPSFAEEAIGVAPGASLVIAKVLNAAGSGTDAQVIEGIEFCAGHPDVDILSMSLGGGPTDGTDPLSVAVNCVADPSPGTCGGSNAAKIIVVSAGNAGALSSTIGTPGSAANAITVGSIAEWSGDPALLWQDDGLYLNTYSSRGPVVDDIGTFVRIKPDIVGPGSRVLSAYIDGAGTPNSYAVVSGTSMSTPFVAGVIAMMLQANPLLGVVEADGVLPHEKVRTILASTAEDRGAPGFDNEYGHGVIDAYSAVAEALSEVGYEPNAYPGYTRLPNQNVADFGNWTEEFTVTGDLVGFPIAATATIDGVNVFTCYLDLWIPTPDGPVCLIPLNAWSPDLEIILEKEVTPNSWSQVSPASGEVTLSECPAFGECGVAGRAEVVHFIPQSAGNYRFRVFPANDATNAGMGGSFDFEISMGLPVSGPLPNVAPTATITAPPDGTTYAEGDSIAFTGSADDAEDGDMTASLSWTSNHDGNIGSGASPSTSTLSVNTHTITASVTDSGGLSGQDTITVIVQPAPPPGVVAHIADLDDMSVSQPRNRWDAIVAVLVVDAGGVAVSDAQVDGSWSSGANGSGNCITGVSGQCTITKANLKGNVAPVTFTVTNVSGAIDSYDFDANVETTIDLDPSGPPANQSPSATITAPANDSTFDEGVLISFTGSASDAEDGDLTASLSWSSNHDGIIGGGASPSTSTLSVNTHTITASVTDSGGLGGQDEISITVGSPPPPPPPGDLTLQIADGYKVKGVQTVDLTWIDATGDDVEIHRDGVNVETTANDGAHTHIIGAKGGGSYAFMICEIGGGPCSNTLMVAY